MLTRLRRRWTRADGSGQGPRGCSTLCLAFAEDLYQQVIDDPAQFRQALDRFYRDLPELFPRAFAQGYRLQDAGTSAQRGIRLRRIRCTATGEAVTIRPCFVLPYRTGYTDDVADPLFWRSCGVPFWALARVFGRGSMSWYRLEVGLGRHSIVGTTLRRAELPEHLLADEHHQPRAGVKNYIATTVAEGRCPGAAVAPTAGAEDWQAAYAVCKRAAQNVQPDYQPRAVNTDGWAATQRAWVALFPLVVLLRCFLHGWWNLRSRGKLSAGFPALSEKGWDAYHAPNRRSFAQRLRRLGEWAQGQSLTAWLLEPVQKLCGRAKAYGEAYRHPGGKRTSTMLDRVMRSMSRY